MSEPIVLHAADGKTLTLYGQSQAETLVAGGAWYWTLEDAKAAKPGKNASTQDEPAAVKPGGKVRGG